MESDKAKLFEKIDLHTKKFSQGNDVLAWKALFATLVWTFVPILTYNYIPTFLYIFLRSYLSVRLFMIFHDCCHNSFFQTNQLNSIVGTFLGGLVFTPYKSFRERHLYHHKVSGQEGIYDPGATILLTSQEYYKLPLYKRAIFRIIRDPFFFFFVIAPLKFMIWHRFRPGGIITNIIGGLWYVLLFYYFQISWVDELGVAILGPMAGFALFHLQHAVNDPYVMEKEKHSIKQAAISGSTFLYVPFWLKPMTFGIEYHHIHHFNTKVPAYKLQECHEAADQQLWSKCLYVDSMKALRSIFHTLYNKEKNQYESFSFYEKLLRQYLPEIN